MSRIVRSAEERLVKGLGLEANTMKTATNESAKAKLHEQLFELLGSFQVGGNLSAEGNSGGSKVANNKEGFMTLVWFMTETFGPPRGYQVRQSIRLISQDCSNPRLHVNRSACHRHQQ